MVTAFPTDKENWPENASTQFSFRGFILGLRFIAADDEAMERERERESTRESRESGGAIYTLYGVWGRKMDRERFSS